MSLSFSYVPQEQIGIPKPALNGGLYTGESFKKNAPWANVPVIPDVGYMTNVNLRTANPPLDALTQYPGNNRPGNNEQFMPGVNVCSDKEGLMCNKPVSRQEYKEKTPKFGDYYYIDY